MLWFLLCLSLFCVFLSNIFVSLNCPFLYCRFGFLSCLFKTPTVMQDMFLLSFRTAILDPSVVFNLLQFCSSPYYSEEFQDTKGIIRIRNSKTDRQHNDQMKKGETVICKALHRKLTFDQHEPHYKSGMNSGAPEG